MHPLLTDVRVLDLGTLIPGGTASSILAELGADVIKLEPPPVGDYLRDLEAIRHEKRISGQHLTLNRNKRSVSLNVRADGGRDLFFDLVRTADIVLDVSVPGAREKLGIDFAACFEVKPDIIYGSLTAYGYSGKYARYPAHGVGPEVLTGQIPPVKRTDATYTFSLPDVRVPAAASAAFIAIGVLAALRHRDRTGRGLWLETSQVDAAIWWQQLMVLRDQNPDLQVAKPAVTGAGAARYNFYACADGGVILIMPIERKFWQRFCDAIERADLRDRGEWSGGSLDFGGDDVELEGILVEEIRKRPRDEWMEIFAEADVPVMAAMTLSELLSDRSLVEERGYLTTYEHPGVGDVTLANQPVRFPFLESEPTKPAPDMGQDNASILAELGYTERRVSELYESGALFEG
jgi:crotonobetainyl-CoA:carnitine CoA-transferase CaiB-like acyl-CoA transferase